MPGLNIQARLAVMYIPLLPQRTLPFRLPFFSTISTDCKALRQLHGIGYEVAVHTVSHKRLAAQPRAFVNAEVLGARRELAACVGVPEDDVVGFRAPYLEVDPDLRHVLHQGGFLYDSSIVDEAPAGFGARRWPADLGGGVPYSCTSVEGAYGTHRQLCQPDER